MKKFKRLIAIVTVLLFALSIIAPAFAQDEATTEETGSVYDQAAKILQDKGILKGNEQGDLMLDKELTRAEILAMIIRATGQEDVVKDYVYAEQSFSDVPQDHWAFAYVEAGKDLGIVNGYPDGTFKPDRKVKFEELCKMLVAAKGESPAAGTWPLNYVRKALDLGFFNGIEDEVGIGTIVKRGQAAVAFANAFFPPEKTVVVKDVKPLANDTIQVSVDVYLNNEPATLEDGDVIPLDFEIKDASDETKTVAVTLIDTEKSDFASGKIVLKTAAQTANATYKLYFKGKDTGLKFVAVPVPLTVTKVEALNYKEIKVTFNRAVDNDTYATTTGNYTVKVGTATVSVSNAALASDKKSVTLLLADKFTKDDTVTVTVSKNVGMSADYTATISNFMDTTAPQVESVVASGLMKVVVTFSEPVQGADNPINYVIDNTYAAASVSADATKRVYTITFYNPLAAGNHTIQFNNITDYAGYGLVTPVKTFAMTKDDTPVSTPTVVSATQTKVELKFNKDIARVTNVRTSPAGTFTGVDYNGSTVTLKFDADNALPASGAVIKIDVTDSSGNTTTDISVTVTPTVDVTRPVVTSVSVDSETQLTVVFNKDVRINVGEKYELKASDGTIYTPTSIAYGDANSKVKLTFSGLSAGSTYTLNISGVKDATPLKNEIIPTSFSVTISDKSAPNVAGLYKELTSDGKIAKIYIVYSEKVSATTAVNPANYTFLYSDNTSKAVSSISSAYMSLLGDGKTVVIDFKSNPQTDNITGLIIANVADLNGNTLSGKVVTTWSTKAASTVITGAKLTAQNTIEVSYSGNALLTVAPTDFIIFYKDSSGKDVPATYPASVSFDSSKITITLNSNLNTDATVTVNNKREPVGLKLNPSGVATVDIFDNKLGPAGFVLNNLTDACRPTVTISAGDKYGTIKLAFSENMNAFVPFTSVALYKGSDKVDYQTYTWADGKTLILGTANKDVNGVLAAGVYKVVVTPDANVKDVNGNVLGYVAPVDVYVANTSSSGGSTQPPAQSPIVNANISAAQFIGTTYVVAGQITVQAGYVVESVTVNNTAMKVTVSGTNVFKVEGVVEGQPTQAIVKINGVNYTVNVTIK